jgi:hypothetical protein
LTCFELEHPFDDTLETLAKARGARAPPWTISRGGRRKAPAAGTPYSAAA